MIWYENMASFVSFLSSSAVYQEGGTICEMEIESSIPIIKTKNDEDIDDGVQHLERQNGGDEQP